MYLYLEENLNSEKNGLRQTWEESISVVRTVSKYTAKTYQRQEI
jgi:hypothetical protein